MEQQQENKVPEFMQKYHAGSDDEGRAKLEAMAKRYERRKQEFQEFTMPARLELNAAWNRLTGKNKELNAEVEFAPVTQAFGQKAKEIAVQHGYVELEAQEEIQLTEKQQEFLKLLEGQKKLSQQKPENTQDSNATEDDPMMKQDAFALSLKAARERNQQRKHIRRM